jgi:hypothetical protein
MHGLFEKLQEKGIILNNEYAFHIRSRHQRKCLLIIPHFTNFYKRGK